MGGIRWGLWMWCRASDRRFVRPAFRFQSRLWVLAQEASVWWLSRPGIWAMRVEVGEVGAELGQIALDVRHGYPPAQAS